MRHHAIKLLLINLLFYIGIFKNLHPSIEENPSETGPSRNIENIIHIKDMQPRGAFIKYAKKNIEKLLISGTAIIITLTSLLIYSNKLKIDAMSKINESLGSNQNQQLEAAKKIKELEESLNTLKISYTREQEKINGLINQIKDAEKHTKTLESKIASLESEKAKILEDHSSKSQELEIIKSEVTTLRERVSDITRQKNILEDNLEKHRIRLAAELDLKNTQQNNLSQKLNELKSEHNKAKEDIQKTQMHYKEQFSELAKLLLAKAERARELLEKNIKDLKEEKNEIQSQLDKNIKALEELGNHFEANITDLYESKYRLTELMLLGQINKELEELKTQQDTRGEDLSLHIKHKIKALQALRDNHHKTKNSNLPPTTSPSRPITPSFKKHS